MNARKPRTITCIYCNREMGETDILITQEGISHITCYLRRTLRRTKRRLARGKRKLSGRRKVN